MGRNLGPDHPYVKSKVPQHGQNQWPDDLPGFAENLETYFSRMLGLGRHLMSLLALSLSLKEDYFDYAVRQPAALLRLIHYPPHPADAAIGQFGAGAHTDFGGITILAQDDCGGLEVENAAGEWIEANPIPGTFVINLGDMMKRWTNEVYHSAPHRVLNNISGRDRYSIPLFFTPDYLARVECVPTCVPATGKPKYAPCTAGEHIAERFRKSYAKSDAR
jgi:isopenicillin N synthase-like dioxygenase